MLPSKRTLPNIVTIYAALHLPSSFGACWVQELGERDTILSRLESELADAKARLATGDVPQVATLTEENAQLKQVRVVG